MKSIFLYKTNEGITNRKFVFRHSDVNKYNETRIADMIVKRMHKIPEIKSLEGNIILTTVLNIDFIKKYLILDIVLKEKKEHIGFFIEDLYKYDKNQRRVIYNFAVKTIINLFNKQPISEKIDMNSFDMDLNYSKFILVDNEYLFKQPISSTKNK